MKLDSKQKTKTKITFWYVLLDFIDSRPFPRKQKQKQGCTSHIWMSEHLWHLWPKCDQICFAKNTKKKLETQTRSQSRNRDILWPSQMSQMVTRWVTLVQTLFLILFGIRITTTPPKKERKRSHGEDPILGNTSSRGPTGLIKSMCWIRSKFFKNQVETCRQNFVEIIVCCPSPLFSFSPFLFLFFLSSLTPPPFFSLTPFF